MKENKKPKFKIGDTVVIKLYGTVGRITDIKSIDGMYVYEINNSEGLFMESGLVSLSEYEGHVSEQEHINIEYNFFIGDLVQVKGYGADLFKIVGFRTEIWRYKEEAWEDIIYELSRITDGKWLEATEDQLMLVANAEHADAFLNKLGFLFFANKKEKKDGQKQYTNHFRKEEMKYLQEKYERKKLIDMLLDLYNDYSILYEWFKDEEYNQMKKIILLKLEQISKDLK